MSGKKTIRYNVTVQVEDNGQFDQFIMQNGIVSGINRAIQEGELSAIDDTSTLIHGISVQYVYTL